MSAQRRAERRISSAREQAELAYFELGDIGDGDAAAIEAITVAIDELRGALSELQAVRS